MIERAAQRKRVVVRGRRAAFQWMLFASVGDERHVDARERFVESVAARRRRIDAHHRRNPFHRARTVRGRPLERLHAIPAIGMDRRAPGEPLRMLRGGPLRVRVGHPEHRSRRNRIARLVMEVVHREQQEPGARRKCVVQRGKPRPIALRQHLARALGACRVRVELEVDELERMRDARHGGIDPRAVGFAAGAEQMHVRVPDLRGIQTRPRRFHHRVPGEVLRHGQRSTRVPQSLVRP